MCNFLSDSGILGFTKHMKIICTSKKKKSLIPWTLDAGRKEQRQSGNRMPPQLLPASLSVLHTPGPSLSLILKGFTKSQVNRFWATQTQTHKFLSRKASCLPTPYFSLRASLSRGPGMCRRRFYNMLYVNNHRAYPFNSFRTSITCHVSGKPTQRIIFKITTSLIFPIIFFSKSLYLWHPNSLL